MKKLIRSTFSFARKAAGAVCAGIIGTIATVKSSFAALDLTGVTLDIAPVEAAAIVVIGGSVAIWAIVATIGMFRRGRS